ncbi:Lysine--tRNA ligase [compost metagenome]
MADQEEDKLVAERRAKLKALREKGPAFPNDFRRKDYAADLAAAMHPEIGFPIACGELAYGLRQSLNRRRDAR